MTLAPGTRLGPFEVLAPLGAGGMGEVYRARDSRLGRDVAIKALPAAFARDPERLARFEREAKLLASLSHPNIAGIHGLEHVGDARYLVLEYVDGESLAQRLARGPLPLDDALDVARQIAAGVEAAHESGVVHRDLKPGNVMLTPAGVVKVLDFGLAKAGATDAASSDANLSASPTMTYAATGAGVILGTAAYMSPEQARGKAVDRRTDIWSFGCVLYECLTGRPLFAGETVSDLIAKILQTEPDWSALPPSTPQRLRRLLERCLRKDAKERLRDIGDARIELAEIAAAGPDPFGAATPAARGAGGARRAIVVGAMLAALVLGAFALGALLPGLRGAAPRRATRLTLLSASGELGDLGSYAISPDGGAVVFALADSQGTTRLWVRPLDTDAARLLDGTDDAQWPFWSPDSRDIAFFAGGHLRRVPAAGGSVREICEASNGRGGSWGRAGVIVFAPDPVGGLAAVEAGGGVARPVTAVDTTHGDRSHRFPSFLPDGRHFLFVIGASGDRLDTHVMIGSIDAMTPTALMTSSSAATFAAPDRVIYARDRALLSQRIDLRTLRMSGEPALLADQPETVGGIQFSPPVSCSGDGRLLYSPPDRRPVAAAWLELDGRMTATRLRFPAGTSLPALAPDHRRVAVVVYDSQGYANWLGDLEEGTVTQIAPTGKGLDEPTWNPAGTRLLGASLGGLRQLDPGSGADSVFQLGDHVWRVPGSWTPDGSTLVLSSLIAGNRFDLETLALRPGEKPRPYLATTAAEYGGWLSHDGRFIAYVSDASGTPELRVERFPDHAENVRSGLPSPGPNATVLGCAWRADDRELRFIGGDGYTEYAAEVRAAPRLSLGAPRAIRRIPRDARNVLLTDDGRLLVLRPEGRFTPSLTVVQGWMDAAAEKR